MSEPYPRVWYAEVARRKLGPFTQPELLALLRSKQWPWGTLIWRQGMAKWRPHYEEFPEVPQPRIAVTQAAAPPAAPASDLDQLASAAREVVQDQAEYCDYYRVSPQRGPHGYPMQVELTSKRWKSQMVLSSIVFFFGAIICFVGMAAARSIEIAIFGGIVMLAGSIWGACAKFGAWWEHG